MVKDKVKFSLWLYLETRAEVEYLWREDNCGSQSKFVEKAIRFYAGYLHTKKASEYLLRVLGDVIEGKSAVIMKKLGKLLFKHSVETNITNHILCADTDIDVPTYQHLRNRSVREVRETNGELTFKDTLIFQKTV